MGKIEEKSVDVEQKQMKMGCCEEQAVPYWFKDHN